MNKNEQLEYIKLNFKTKSNKELANDLGLSIRRITMLKSELGINPCENRSILKEEKCKYIREHHKDMTYAQLAEALNCSKANISRLIVEMKITKLNYEKAIEMPNEIFKQLDLIECSNYYVSNYGRIKNIKNNIIIPNRDKGGYFNVRLYNDKHKYKNMLVHRLVAIIFIPNPENKREVNHKDGNKCNNHVDNLEWVTPKENSQHSWKTGLSKRKQGEQVWNAKSEKDVRIVCELLEKNYYPKDIVALHPEYNINWIISIKNGYNWKHISSDYNF